MCSYTYTNFAKLKDILGYTKLPKSLQSFVNIITDVVVEQTTICVKAIRLLLLLYIGSIIILLRQ